MVFDGFAQAGFGAVEDASDFGERCDAKGDGLMSDPGRCAVPDFSFWTFIAYFCASILRSASAAVMIGMF